MSDLHKLIEAHNGDMALYYIWRCVYPDAPQEQASKDLCITLDRIKTADELLKLYNITVTPSVFHPMPAEEPKEYSSNELTDTYRNDPTYVTLLSKCEVALKHTLTKDDMSKLLDIYKNLDLGADVIYVLLEYFARKNETERVTMKRISSLAYSWANSGILTAEQAEAWVEERPEYTQRENHIKQMLGIYSGLTSNSQSLIDSWISSGYSDDSIYKAYEITMDRLGKLNWKYMSTVLSNLDKDGTGLSSSDQKSSNESDSLPDTIIRRKS